ncbi:MAG: DUF1932 domain-containing protein, partial [Pyramidobacter sp.]|nr:DUF1932 domain-containing protein [Pyramidobacter sp.]
NILESVSNSMDKESFKELAQRMAGADLVHSERRAFEVGEAMELMEEVGVEPLIAAGAKKRLEHSAAMGMNKELGGKAPKTWEEVFAVWEKKNYK